MSEDPAKEAASPSKQNEPTEPGSDGQPQAEPAAESTPAATGVQVDFDAAHIPSLYINFARVTGSPEEMIIDFGLNAQPFGTTDQPVPISERIVMNYYTAKRFLGALNMAVQRHEQAFGVLETDINKRVVPAARRPAT